MSFGPVCFRLFHSSAHHNFIIREFYFHRVIKIKSEQTYLDLKSEKNIDHNVIRLNII